VINPLHSSWPLTAGREDCLDHPNLQTSQVIARSLASSRAEVSRVSTVQAPFIGY